MGELKKCFTIEGGAVGQIKVVNLLSEYQCGDHWSNHNLMKPLVLEKIGSLLRWREAPTDSGLPNALPWRRASILAQSAYDSSRMKRSGM